MISLMEKKTFATEVAGKKLEATFSDLAEQATGSVTVRYGDTVVLATAVMNSREKDGDFFPLTVDFEERFYAAGKILGSQYMRREGKPSDVAILSGRIIDRTIRPLFDQWIRNEIQVVITLLALDEGDVNVASVLAASLAIATSPIPWNGPVSAIRIGKIRGTTDFIINSTYAEKAGLELDLLACGKDGLINMIEAMGYEVGEKTMAQALEKASEEIEKLQKFQQKIISEISKEKKIIPKPETPTELISLFGTEIAPRLETAVFSGPGHTHSNELKSIWMKLVTEKLPEDSHRFADEVFEEKVNGLLHEKAIDAKRRADGRKMDEVRPLYVEAGGVSPILHGSGTFYRGGTHVLSVATLGGPKDSQTIDGLTGEEKKRYMHHYNFPPFSTGETGRSGSTNRRMIGHGTLAEKALVPVLPPAESFPYTIRVVSEAFASNGSTSMASVCGSTIALMDAGVPLKAPVAGIASGLMIREKKGMLSKTKYEYEILTDIQGPEDHHGDMDFKVAGTKTGVTAVQMDVKVGGISLSILTEAFEKARLARLHILNVMTGVIKEPRADISPRAPKIVMIKIKQDQIGLVIGSGGKTIKEIKEKTGAEIDIEDDGSVFITGVGDSTKKARAIIEDMTRVYAPGDRFEGEVVKILDFGVFVRIGNNAEGLVHVSELAPWRIEKTSALVKLGDRVPVIVKEVDERGRINLSIRKANPEFFGKPPATETKV
jgi:polyribonucleotide nucleotidyltransferase